ncbi:MAG: hypothetical protein HC904_14560, partial [Blastochloris sp.]|nr:hypothetical protein [Blastochloris sp.]
MATPPFPPNPNLPSGAKLPTQPPSGVAQKPILPPGALIPKETININAQGGPNLKTTQKKLKKETMRISLPPKPGQGQPMSAIPAAPARPAAPINPLKPPTGATPVAPSANKMMMSVTRPIGITPSAAAAVTPGAANPVEAPTAAIPSGSFAPRMAAPPVPAPKPVNTSATTAPLTPPAMAAPSAPIKPVVAAAAPAPARPMMPTVPIAP